MTAQIEGTVVKDRVDANGLDTYYEVHGRGEPLVYLHGGFNPIELFVRNIGPLAAGHRLYMPERQGQGRTPDRDGPITFESMARDTIAFFDAVGLSSAHLAGFSDGGMVAMHVAIERPDLVRKLVIIGQYANPDGCPARYRDMMTDFTPDNFPAVLREMCEALSPDGSQHFATVFDKLKRNWLAPGLALEQLSDIRSPTLVVIGDDDCVTPEHAAAMVRHLPKGSQFAVVPGATHGLPYEKPDLVDRLILEFLDPERQDPPGA